MSQRQLRRCGIFRSSVAKWMRILPLALLRSDQKGAEAASLSVKRLKQ